MPITKIVLAYSGGLDTSVAIPWLKEHYGDCEVIGYCADVGQDEPLQEARERGLATGASICEVDDLRETFVEDYVFPAFRAGAIYEAQYLLGTSLARPCIAKGLVDTANKYGAEAIAHGATGKGNDQVRFELAAYALRPDIKIVAPWREWKFKGRAELMAYAAERNIPVEASVSKPYSIDRNALHTSYEGGILEDPWEAPPEEMFQLTKSPQDAPDKPLDLDIEFRAGDPVAINGVAYAPYQLLTKLNELAGEHAVGRVDLVENRFVGMKSRGVYETPGGTVIYAARQAVESLTLDKAVLHQRLALTPEYARMLYNGFWFAPEREALQMYFDQTSKVVNGVCRLRLYKGSLTVLGRKSPNSLYDPEIATFEESDYDHRDANGFIRLNALRLRIRANQMKG